MAVAVEDLALQERLIRDALTPGQSLAEGRQARGMESAASTRKDHSVDLKSVR
jgi:hypothetical protein